MLKAQMDRIFLFCFVFGMAWDFSAHSYSIHNGQSSSNPESSLIFSLKDYQRQCALEASQSLDASRLHFQILFVDDDNAKGRIAEGLLARIAEHNDAMSVLFPASATISSSRYAPRDAAASATVLKACQSLGLCPTRSETLGTDFCLRYLNDYDLVLCMSEEIQSLIVRSIADSDDQDYYRPRCRLLSEFLSPNFVTSTMNHEEGKDHIHNVQDKNVQWGMLDSFYQDRIRPYFDKVLDRSSNLFATTSNIDSLVQEDWPITEAGLILASGGVTKFCLATIEAQLVESLDTLLERIMYKEEHRLQKWEDVDEQLHRCNHAVAGYFSPGQRKARFEKHLTKLRAKWDNHEDDDTKSN